MIKSGAYPQSRLHCEVLKFTVRSWPYPQTLKLVKKADRSKHSILFRPVFSNKRKKLTTMTTGPNIIFFMYLEAFYKLHLEKGNKHKHNERFFHKSLVLALFVHFFLRQSTILPTQTCFKWLKQKESRAVFTTLHFLRNLRIGPISYSVT
jgi:hypothetical protein